MVKSAADLKIVGLLKHTLRLFWGMWRTGKERFGCMSDYRERHDNRWAWRTGFLKLKHGVSNIEKLLNSSRKVLRCLNEFLGDLTKLDQGDVIVLKEQLMKNMWGTSVDLEAEIKNVVNEEAQYRVILTSKMRKMLNKTTDAMEKRRISLNNTPTSSSPNLGIFSALIVTKNTTMNRLAEAEAQRNAEEARKADGQLITARINGKIKEQGERVTITSTPITIRNAWTVGSLVEVYSVSNGGWFTGKISKTWDDGLSVSWLQIQYLCVAEGKLMEKDEKRLDDGVVRPYTGDVPNYLDF